MEGASGKISRRQAVIQMKGFGDFYILNQGRHSIFVDHVHVPYGGMTKLNDGCVIQVSMSDSDMRHILYLTYGEN